MARKSKTPRYDDAVAWLAQAKKGETFEFWRGQFAKACKTPEQNISNAERRKHQADARAAKKAGLPKPKLPDPYKSVRADARALEEFVDYWELRGLVETSITVVDERTRSYTITCLIQRNGLAAVRARR